jgi:hypothetical protein
LPKRRWSGLWVLVDGVGVDEAGVGWRLRVEDGVEVVQP